MPARRFTQQQVIDALEATRGLVTLAAAHLHCAPNTIYAFVDRFPRVRAARDAARERQLDVAEAKLFQSIDRGELPAITFLLRTLGRHRGYGEHVQVDATVDVLQTPQWLRTRALLMSALRTYPEAMRAVVLALESPRGTGDVDEDAG